MQLAALYEETSERPPVDRGISLEDGARKAGLQLREKRLRREGLRYVCCFRIAPMTNTRRIIPVSRSMRQRCCGCNKL